MSDKTEKPTAKKLREARRKGQVAYSKDFTQTILLLVVFGYFIGAGTSIMQELMALVRLPGQVVDLPFTIALDALMTETARVAIAVLAPILLIVVTVGIFADMLQVGINFAFEAIKPSGKKLNVAANAKNLFSKKNLIEFLKNIVKVVFLSVLIFLVVQSSLDTLIKVPPGGISSIIKALGALVVDVMAYTAVAYIIVAAFDFLFQRSQHTKQLMMSKDEVKREYKEMEGDPHIKGKRKQLHQELMAASMIQQTRKASVVITNPTHIAIAVFYDKDETPLPVIMAKAEGALAHRIMEVAAEEGIPIMRNVPLARALFDQGELNQYVPSELLEPVAEVLRWVQEINRRP